MERFIGLDVHRDSCTIRGDRPIGQAAQVLRVETNGRAIHQGEVCVWPCA